MGVGVDDVTTSNRYRKIAGSKNSLANFETVKMLAREVPFLLENVLRIRFYLYSNKNYLSKKTETENLILAENLVIVNEIFKTI